MKNLWPLVMLVLSSSMVACVTSTDDTSDEDTESTSEALTTYVPTGCDATCQSNGTLAAMNAVAKKYGFPRWFVYAQVRRESSFKPGSITGNGSGVGCDAGFGLTQLTCPDHQGMPYPEGLSTPSATNTQYQNDMRIPAFCKETGLCPWIDMTTVTKLTSRTDAMQNLDRYFSGYAAPAYWLEAKRAPQQSGESAAAFHNRILRRVVWHWRYGHYESFAYPTDPSGYLSSSSDHYRFDDYANEFRAALDPVDGVWDGNVCKPPYSANGCSKTTTTTTTTTSTTSGTAYALTGTATQAFAIAKFGLPTAGKTVSFHVYIPAGANISWVQAYVQQGASGNWAWTTATKNMSSLTAGAWNTISVQVPSTATSIATIGLQFGKTSSSWSGNVNVDSVTW